MDQFRKYLPEGIAVVCCSIFYSLTLDLPFFWDSIQLSSKQAHFFWENEFRYFWLPADLDSGHPPFMGIYLAAWWSILGRTLWVSHLAMLPFVFVYLVYSWKLLKHIVPDDKPVLFMGGILIAIDPLFLSQSAIMSPDIILMSAFAACILGYVKRNHWLIGFSCIMLGVISMRGAMVLAGLGIFHILDSLLFKKLTVRNTIASGISMLPGTLIFLIFLLSHFLHTGWIGFNDNSPWATSFVPADLRDLGKNLMVFIWRLMDNGRIFLWLVLLAALLKNRFINQVFLKKGLMLFFLLALILMVNTVLYKHLTAQRYFWPLLWLITIGAVSAAPFIQRQLRYVLLCLAIMFFMAAHCIKYPETVAQDWETTLIHLPYHELMSGAESEIHSRGILKSEVGTAFPAINLQYHTHLTIKDTSWYENFNLWNHSYIIWNSVMNDMRPYKDKIGNNYVPVWQKEKGLLKVILYQKKGEQ